MLKRNICAVLIIGITLSLTGCKDPMPELSQEDQQKVVEYAADVVKKNDINAERKLLSDEELQVAEAKEKEKQERLAAFEKNSKKSDSANKDAGTTAENNVVENVDMATFFGLKNISITYTSCEVADSYPSDGSEDAYFAMEATKGNKLLILHFTVTNTGEEQNLDLFSKNARFKTNINDTGNRSVLSTLLSNDLAVIKENILPNESKEAVLIQEIGENEKVSSIVLTMISGDQIGTQTLQ